MYNHQFEGLTITPTINATRAICMTMRNFYFRQLMCEENKFFVNLIDVGSLSRNLSLLPLRFVTRNLYFHEWICYEWSVNCIWIDAIWLRSDWNFFLDLLIDDDNFKDLDKVWSGFWRFQYESSPKLTFTLVSLMELTFT